MERSLATIVIASLSILIFAVSMARPDTSGSGLAAFYKVMPECYFRCLLSSKGLQGMYKSANIFKQTILYPAEKINIKNQSTKV